MTGRRGVLRRTDQLVWRRGDSYRRRLRDHHHAGRERLTGLDYEGVRARRHPAGWDRDALVRKLERSADHGLRSDRDRDRGLRLAPVGFRVASVVLETVDGFTEKGVGDESVWGDVYFMAVRALVILSVK